MARVILTSPVVIPASGGQPAQILPKGSCMEVTAAMAAVIAGAGGTSRNVTAMSGTAAHDQLGEAVGVSNSSA
jgi:hypothetical protein